MKINHGNEISFGSVTSGSGLGRLDQTVDAFQDAVVDFGREPAQDPIPMSLYGISRFFDGLQPAVGCPEIPLFQKGFRRGGRLLVELLEIEPDMVGAAGFQVEFFNRQLFKQIGL